jgi:hypothetical protein
MSFEEGLSLATKSKRAKQVASPFSLRSRDVYFS